jgi:MFS family permease
LLRRSPKFGLLWAARTVSFAGDSLAHIALVLYVADRGGGGPAVAALLVVTGFAPAVFAPLLGSLGDRIDRRRLMIVTAVLQAAIVLAIAFWLPELFGLLVLVAVNAYVAQVFQPASAGAVGQLVADADLGLANSMIGFGTYGLAVTGPLGVAVLTPLLGLRGVLVVDAATFAVSALLLVRLPALPPCRGSTARSAVWCDAISGLRYVWGNRVVRIVVFGFAGLVACTALDDVALVFLPKHTLSAGNSATSLPYAGADIGLLVGFVALTRCAAVRGAVVRRRHGRE